jgi:hypothetical protein
MIQPRLLPYAIAGATGALVAFVVPLFINTSHADTRLLPFQGRLTNADGTPITPDQAKVVEFKMYDAPTGGTVKWAGEVHKLSVNGGLVNTMLGTKAPLGGVDFSTTPTYLQITVDANNDGQITSADPPLLPRQSVVGALYASVAGEIQYNTSGALASVKGSDLFDTAGKIKALAIEANNKITAAQLAENSVESSEIKDGTITALDIASGVVDGLLGNNSVYTNHIKDGEVKTGDLAGRDTAPAEPGAVTSEKIRDFTIVDVDVADGTLSHKKLAPRDLATSGTIAAIGNVAQGVMASSTVNFSGSTYDTAGITADLRTTGRPVFVGLTPKVPAGTSLVGSITTSGSPTNGSVLSWRLLRSGTEIAAGEFNYADSGANASRSLTLPAGVIWAIDTPAAGTYSYDLQINAQGYSAQLKNVRLVAFEL